MDEKCSCELSFSAYPKPLVKIVKPAQYLGGIVPLMWGSAVNNDNTIV